MKELSHIALQVKNSPTMAIDSMFKQMKAEGKNVIGFAAGEPDFDTPDHIKEAAIQAIHDNFTRYTAASGMLSLKQAICDRVRADFGESAVYTPEQVVVSGGAKHILYLALQALLNDGDEVIIFTPGYVSYFELVRMAGGVPVNVPTLEENGFKPEPAEFERAITSKTKAVIFNSPGNPTGAVYSEAELRDLTEICIKHDLYIISDEIYSCLVYDGKPYIGMATLGERVRERLILVNGVSKAYAMTGWRIGYGLTTEKIAKVMSSYVSQSTGSPCAVSQKAALEGLTASQELVGVMRDAFEKRRDYMVSRINGLNGVSCIKPEGAFYVMMNIQKLLGSTIGDMKIENALDFASAFLKYGLVAVIPGDGFGAEGYIRWTYAASMENIKEGMDRLERFLNQLKS